MAKSELEKYKETVYARLSQLSPLLQNYALGDFSESIEIPEEEDEFTELLVGLSLMVDNIKKLVEEKESTITEWVQAEAVLKSERDKLRVLMDRLARTDIGIDVVGIDYRVLLQSQTLRERFGDLTGELCYEKYMGLKEPCDFCPMVAAIQSGKVESVELTRVDGRSYELLSAPLPDADGTVDKAIEVVKDITERKRAEEELARRVEELERFNRLAVGRELRMIELKRQINELSEQLGKEPPYDVSFAEEG
jgi:PAS domain-containing protein